MPLNIIISIAIVAIVVALIYKKLKNNQNAKVVEDVVIENLLSQRGVSLFVFCQT